METCARTDNRDNLCIIGHPRSEENHRNKNEKRHERNNQIYNPIWIKIDEEFTYRKSVGLNSWSFCLNVNHQNNNRQQTQHEPESSEVFFDDI